MSNTKTLKGRVINKHKTEAAWLLDVYPNGDITLEPRADAFIPLDGELIIYDPDDFHPKRRFKFGDGITYVSNLPFMEESKLPNLTENDENKIIEIVDGEYKLLTIENSSIGEYIDSVLVRPVAELGELVGGGE